MPNTLLDLRSKASAFGDRARLLWRLGRLAEAEVGYREAFDTLAGMECPDETLRQLLGRLFVVYRAELALLLSSQHRATEAQAMTAGAEQALKAAAPHLGGEETWWSLAKLADAHAALSHWADVVEVLVACERYYGGNSLVDQTRLRAIALLAQEDLDGYAAACRRLLECVSRFEPERRVSDLRWPEMWLWTCAVSSAGAEDRERAIGLARGLVAKLDALVADPDEFSSDALREVIEAEVRLALGALLYRGSRFEEAATELERAAQILQPRDTQDFGPATTAPADRDLVPSLTSCAYPRFFLAMAQYSLGRTKEARESLASAMRIADGELNSGPPPTWARRVTLQMLKAEAERTIGAELP